MTGEDPAVAAAAGLVDTFRAMTEQMTRLTRSQKWYRRIIIILVISFSLDLAVTAGLGYNTIRQNNVEGTIRQNDIQQCMLSNMSRSQDIAVWNRLLKAPASASAAQKAEAADLERLVGIKDALRNCIAAYLTVQAS